MLEMFSSFPATSSRGGLSHYAHGVGSDTCSHEPSADLPMLAMPLHLPRPRSHKALARAMSLLAPVDGELLPLAEQPHCRRRSSGQFLPTAMLQDGLRHVDGALLPIGPKRTSAAAMRLHSATAFEEEKADGHLSSAWQWCTKDWFNKSLCSFGIFTVLPAGISVTGCVLCFVGRSVKNCISPPPPVVEEESWFGGGSWFGGDEAAPAPAAGGSSWFGGFGGGASSSSGAASSSDPAPKAKSKSKGKSKESEGSDGEGSDNSAEEEGDCNQS